MFDVRCGDRPKRPKDLDLLVADRRSVEIGRRLHRDEREQLEHMVLHHVPKGAGLIIIIPAALDPNRLGDRDLDVLDMGGVPQGLEREFRKAEREKVLDRLLAEIMVDPERAIFGKGAATASLISRLDSRSVPSGFSSAMRTVGQASPAASRPSIVGLNKDGAVERKIATPWQGSPTFAARSRKCDWSLMSSGT